MPFTSVTFLFCFLPLVITIYLLLPTKARNFWLFLASLLFYAWPNPNWAVLLLISIAFNWLAGWGIQGMPYFFGKALLLTLAVAANLAALAYYKYSAFFSGIAAWPLPFPVPLLPAGISFLTFHAISYLVDIFRRQARAFANPLNLGVYLALFPQLIAGPIIRFHDLAGQIRQRVLTVPMFTLGAERFIVGLAKKLMVADPLGQVASHVFALPAEDLSTGNAWFGLACYTLQIYYDFSGYSDMAIGMGGMLGFRFPENFQYPYAATSVREFWRRWHISLSTWFRDYVYIPLGGNRGSPFAVGARLLTVFFLCGLWHGANLTFVGWGLLHGFFLSLERGIWGRWLAKLPRAFGHFYTLGVVMLGWVLFRADNLEQAEIFYRTLFGLHSGSSYGNAIMVYFTAKTWWPFGVGILLAVPFLPSLVEQKYSRALECSRPWLQTLLFGGRHSYFLALFFLSACFAAAETFRPFLYFQF